MTDTGQPGKPADDSAGDQPDAGGEVYYSFARERSVFALVCAALPGVVLGAAYLPHLTGVSSIVVGIFAVFVILMGLWQLVLHRIMVAKSVTLSEEGIRAGRRFARWDEITGVRMCPFLRRPVALTLGKRQRSVLARLFQAPGIHLPLAPVVFREVLPEISRRFPHMPASENLRRAMADPEATTSDPRWFGVAFFTLLAGLVMTPYLVRHWHIMWSFVPLFLLYPGAMLIFVTLPAPHTAQQRFVRTALGPGPMVVALAATQAIVLGVPGYVLDTVVAGFAIVILIASIVLVTRAKLTVLRKAVILTIAVLVPALIYAHGVKTSWSKEDITHLVNPPGVPDLFWSEDGALAIEDWVDGNQQRVIDLSTLKATPLPVHAGWQMVRSLDRSCVVRIVRVKKDSALYVYSLRDGRELRMPTAERFRCGNIRCVSPNGRMLCWLDLHDDGGKPSLRSYDLARGPPGTIEVTWPASAGKIEWRGPNWLDDDTVVVWGHDTDLHLLHVRPEEGTTNHISRKAPCAKWSVSPDFRHAFAYDSSDSRGVLYFDLRADRSAELAAGGVPIWQTDNRYAFRAVRRGEQGTWICRFDPLTMIEAPLFKLPTDSELVAVSPKGRLALIQTSRIRLANLAVVELATGKTRWMDVPLAFLMSDSDREPRVIRGGTSIWSPDERRVVLMHLRLSPVGLGTFLYTLPDAWLED